jgi:hypothetical protein
MDKMRRMARRTESREAARRKARAQPKEKLRSTRKDPRRTAQEGVEPARSAKAARTKRGRARAAPAKAARAANVREDTAIKSRLGRLEQAVALQAERSEELLHKLEAVLTNSNQTARRSDGGTRDPANARQSRGAVRSRATGGERPGGERSGGNPKPAQ